MSERSPFTQTFDQLPQTLPIFPLPNAVVLPGGFLPLNIFEPRYLNMVMDAMESHRLIGMIQPRTAHESSDLYQVGCAGRIIRYAETQDGRLEIVLAGVCRFEMAEEIACTRGYRLIKPDWSRFQTDYEDALELTEQQQTEFKSKLKAYLERHSLEADWDSFEQVNAEDLINSLVGSLPLKEVDHQLLLETDTLELRFSALSALLEGDASTEEGYQH